MTTRAAAARAKAAAEAAAEAAAAVAAESPERPETVTDKKAEETIAETEAESLSTTPMGETTTTTTATTDQDTDTAATTNNSNPDPPASTVNDRMARFRALQSRAKQSSSLNLAEATKESQRLASDPHALTTLQRKRDAAAHKLLKAETEEAGEDFERKRAWDWTVEESERWDKRVKKKATARDNAAFDDYRAESNKVYKRQVKTNDFAGNEARDRYERDKMAAIEKAASSGGLDIVETEDGELIAVDKDGSFYSTADSITGFVDSRPDKAAVDRLVADMKKAEGARLKKRRERMAANGDEGDVTYINEKNKQFNQKLARFYNKYTAEIRDSFERGTMV